VCAAIRRGLPSERDRSVATPILALRGISKRYGAVRALDRVDFEVAAGEVVALIGDNGAGKSTLIKVISGVITPEAGSIEFSGQPVTISDPHAATALGIATVFQDLALCENLDVVANLYLGHERLIPSVARLGAWLDEIGMERRALELLRELAVRIPSVRTQVAMLSGGQRQSVAIARSLIGEPQVVLLDEPTAALGVEQTAHVLELILRLRDRGLGVVLVSHNLSNVLASAGRAVVLRLGRNNGTFALPQTTQEQLVAAITGATDTSGSSALTTADDDTTDNA
jgi:D-xylose transport system ATP-binding protein